MFQMNEGRFKFISKNELGYEFYLDEELTFWVNRIDTGKKHYVYLVKLDGRDISFLLLTGDQVIAEFEYSTNLEKLIYEMQFQVLSERLSEK